MFVQERWCVNIPIHIVEYFELPQTTHRIGLLVRAAGETDVEVEQLLLLRHHPVVAPRRHAGRGGGGRRVLERLEGELRAHPQPTVRTEVRQNLNLEERRLRQGWPGWLNSGPPSCVIFAYRLLLATNSPNLILFQAFIPATATCPRRRRRGLRRRRSVRCGAPRGGAVAWLRRGLGS